MGAMYSYNGEIKIMPGIKTKVVDPSCAGDISMVPLHTV